MLGLGNIISPMDKKFQPNDISDCVLALHYSDGLNLSVAATPKVISWQDQSGAYANPIFASQASSGKRPVYSGTHIAFDGSKDRMELHEADLSTDKQITLDTSSNGWTVVAIYSSDNWDNVGQCITGDPDGSTDFIRHKSGANSFEVKVANTLYTLDLDTPSSLTDGQFYSIIVTATAGGTVVLYVDNVAQSDTGTISDTADDFDIEQIAATANGSVLDGNIKHIIVYDKALSIAERLQIHEWSEQYIG